MRINNKKGFTLGEILFVLLAVVIIGALMMPFIRYSRMKTYRVLCADNMRELGRALYIYAMEHNGNFPEDLKVLYEEQYISDRSLVDCPATKKTGTLDDMDYIYTGGLSIHDPSLAPLIRDKDSNHSHGNKNVMYVNGTVSWED